MTTPETIEPTESRRLLDRLVLPFAVRCQLPNSCAAIAKRLDLKAGDRLVSSVIDRHAPHGDDHPYRDKMWANNGNRFVELILHVRFVGSRWVVCDQHMRTGHDGQNWNEWEVREIADFSAGVWHWIRDFQADWELIRS